MKLLTPVRILQAAAFFGFTAVALGAFAAHGLKGVLEPRMLDAFKTGVQYQMFHTLALLALVPIVSRVPESRSMRIAIVGFILGILLFSGSLYAMAISGVRFLGMITPLGGVSFLVAWVSLFISARSSLS